ncbi:polyphosphate kinase 1 [Halomicroarcula sp. GCM10025817]|uniref:polyphosphate kinase 1 n=1 Tax=Haloarcula TaxID=2237 RepID=UPI0023E8E213|nr:polyphosphate kinase 1 [Halomicroarcula sp. SYNS111]
MDTEESQLPEPYDPGAVSLDDPSLYLNRELSELAYQRRVLHEALDDRNPLLERVRFLAIVTRNLDEFVMKRIGGLKQQIEAGVTEETADGRTPVEQFEDVHDTLAPMLERQTACYEETIRPALADEGIQVLDYDDLNAGEQSRMRDYFQESVLPTLTPLSFDPAHPFPFISNRSLSLAVLTRRPDAEDPTFTRVKIPPNQSRLVQIGDDLRYVLLEEVIRANLDLLLPNVDIIDTALFRLTRNAEVRRNEEVAEDLIDMIEEVLEQRRFATVVRMEIEADAHQRIRDTLQRQLELEDREIYPLTGPLDYREFMSLTDLERPDLKLEPWTPQPHPRLKEPSNDPFGDDDGDPRTTVFDDIDDGDILLHHPYHDFGQTVQRFLSAAAEDPDVLAVKAAIYRTASDSQVIQSLIDAAENGKQVAVMVELKARFDEQNNLEWVRRLEENGIHVAYGTIGLKTHTKTALVVREEDDGVNLYSHVGTGNYHSETAKGYVDLGLLTEDRDIGQDLVTLFNSFTGPGMDEQFRKLLIAPVTMRREFTRFIRREAHHALEGRRARIVVKINGLEDPDIVGELYRASMAGVDVDLIVRDICRLRPDLEGISENVEVHSLVGRFLEHSRIYYFENGGDPEYYIGSADWMTRNLDNRVEAVTPVEDRDIRRQLKFNLELILADNRKRWRMHSDGRYEQQTPDADEPVVNTQAILMREAMKADRNEDVVTGVPSDYPVDGDLLVAPVEDEAGPDVVPDDELGPDEPAANSDRTDEALLDRFAEHWYVPDSDTYDYAVRTPDGDRKYLKTIDGAAAALERYYD